MKKINLILILVIFHIALFSQTTDEKDCAQKIKTKEFKKTPSTEFYGKQIQIFNTNKLLCGYKSFYPIYGRDVQPHRFEFEYEGGVTLQVYTLKPVENYFKDMSVKDMEHVYIEKIKVFKNNKLIYVISEAGLLKPVKTKWIAFQV